MSESTDSPSTRPYLIRALFEWCTDNGFTPYIAVLVDDSVRVPNEYVKNGEIVLNISMDATSALRLGNEYIEFKGRFGGVVRDILVPVDRVVAIYARENGQGMAFPMLASSSHAPSEGTQAHAKPAVLTSVTNSTSASDDAAEHPHHPPSPSGGGKPSLKRIK
ncbi:MAG: ClpXP protease specificity-enhancing factor [Rhodoferax sp.]|nr:ClpXP protease specificity-enhancing factor [Rhodoferax sp.]